MRQHDVGFSPKFDGSDVLGEGRRVRQVPANAPTFLERACLLWHRNGQSTAEK